MTPTRIRAAAALCVLIGIAQFAYTIVLTVPLVLEPDPMFGLEIIVSAIMLLAAGSAIGVGVGLTRSAAWARRIAIGGALLMILIAGALPFMSPTTVGIGPPPIGPISWLLGASGIVFLILVVSPNPSG